MGLHEPDYVNEPERVYPAYVCFDCGHVWVPDEFVLEPDEDHGGFIEIPVDRDCPTCGSDDTDEHLEDVRA